MRCLFRRISLHRWLKDRLSREILERGRVTFFWIRAPDKAANRWRARETNCVGFSVVSGLGTTVYRNDYSSAAHPPRAQLHTETWRRTPSHMYVSIKTKTASATFRARITRTSPVLHLASDRREGHVSVCSIVTSGECLISA
jgi:hypothetical protein